jgi:hypothetical protein
MLGLGLALALKENRLENAVGVWILAGAFWSDIGVWEDAATWND